MSKKQIHLFQDIFFLAVSIALAFFIVMSGIAEQIINFLGDLRLLGVFIAGIFFTSIFTAAPSVALLSQFALTTPPILLFILGGFGAMLGDYILFLFIKDRISVDLNYLLSLSGGRKRLLGIFKNQLFKFLLPFIGALIIASPLPDELGVAILGLSKIKKRTFFLISFLLNGAGIYIIGLIARSVVGI